MNKIGIISICVSACSFLIGLFIRNWWEIGTFSINTEISVLDALSLLATIGVGLYIARILEKKVQDERIEKDMYLARIGSIEHILNNIESLIENSKGAEIHYGHIVNMMHRCRIKKSDMFNALDKKETGKLKTQINEYNQKLKVEFQLLKKSLTDTTVSDSKKPAVKLKNNIVSYSEERSLEILSSINTIESIFFELKIIVNNL